MTATTTTWGQTKEAPKSDRKEIKRIAVKPGADKRIRCVGPVLPRYIYWVTTIEGKKAPVECLSFNRVTQTFDDSAKDPFKEIPAEIYKDKSQFAYVCNVIDRANDPEKPEAALYDVKKTVFTQIQQLAQNPEYGDPSDPVKGYDLTLKCEKTGPKPQNVKYTVTPGRNSTPLTEAEQKMELFDLEKLFPRSNYDDQKKWLMEKTTYFAHLANSSEFGAPGTKAEDL